MDANLYISHDDKYERANDVNRLCGVPSESCRSIGWKAETRFEELVRLMLVADMKSEGLNPKNYIKETTE
jgi:GDP-D-mannose dehydratase